MSPRQAYVVKRLGVVLVIGLALFGWIHGIYWAGGINQPGNNWSHRDMPWQAALIDLAPIWVLVVGTLGTMFALIGHDICDELGVTIISDYRSLPKAPTKAQKLAAKRAEREATIARLEQELGLGDPFGDGDREDRR